MALMQHCAAQESTRFNQGLSAKKEVGTAFLPQIKRRLHQIVRRKWAFVYKNFHTGSSSFTAALRCYARDNLSSIHLCCSRCCT